MKTKYSVMLSLIFVSSLYTQHFSVEIDPTGISQLIVFSDSLSGLNPGDEIGIFDSDGILNSGDCSNQTGNVLVGSGIWTGEQLNSVAIGSIDYCAINGFQYAGYVEGHPIQFRVYKPDLMLEFEVEATFSMGNGIFGDLLIMVTELSFPQQYYNLEINPTGEYQLIVFLETITGLNPDDEIGIFDTAGILNSGDCSNQTGELLVGTGIWTGEQNNISAIGSIDYCAVGGYQWAGWVEGNPVNIRVYRPELEMELEPDITFFEGSGEFGETLIVISELTLSVFGCMDVNACNYDPDVIFDDGTCMYEIDCNGECGGDAILDNCGVCDNDPLNDNECYFDGPQNLIAAGGDGEIILNWDIPNWDHSRSSATLYITDVTSEYIEISMINDEDVYGIQFQIQASGLSPNFMGAAGGTAELAGFEFQFSEDGLFIGFDMDGG
ncbi:MAG: hypothetical protein ACE5D7_10565, partial [Fidelibacterota bacterium]